MSLFGVVSRSIFSNLVFKLRSTTRRNFSSLSTARTWLNGAKLNGRTAIPTCIDDAVLDRRFHKVLPFWEEKLEQGMLMPTDFDGVADDHDRDR